MLQTGLWLISTIFVRSANCSPSSYPNAFMTELSFSVGEINLMDLLKIQSRTQQAILNAKESSVIVLRDKALYNQAVGATP
jgi:hypothetical protein